MNVQDLGAIGEFISSVAIVITLIPSRSKPCRRDMRHSRAIGKPGRESEQT